MIITGIMNQLCMPSRSSGSSSSPPTTPNNESSIDPSVIGSSSQSTGPLSNQSPCCQDRPATSKTTPKSTLPTQQPGSSLHDPSVPPPTAPARLPPPRRKTIDDFMIQQTLGSGAYGQVKYVQPKDDPEKRLILKYIIKQRILVDTWIRDLNLGTVPLEVHVLEYLRVNNLQHPNIVEIEGFFEDDANYYLETVPHGVQGMDLFDYIEMKQNMDEAECRNIFSQVVSAIHHLHTKALVVHRDIKDENIIIDNKGHAKLIDFGSATYIKKGPFDSFVGTIYYAAPEVLQRQTYGGKEQDIWALGVLLYTIVYKENPFYDVSEILNHPLRVPFVPFSEDCINLIRRMLDRDVLRRPTITEVAEHPWMTSSANHPSPATNSVDSKNSSRTSTSISVGQTTAEYSPKREITGPSAVCNEAVKDKHIYESTSHDTLNHVQSDYYVV